jgi:hypothetical protein
MGGDVFRSRVANVLRTRYGHATEEYNVGGKDADVFFSMPYPGGKPIKIAVECKDWGSALSSRDVTAIYGEYIPAFESRAIDALWIVAQTPIRAQQRETIDQFGIKLRFFTFASLVDQLIDFGPYLEFLKKDFCREGLNEYYIMPRSDNNRDLHREIILKWLKGNSPNLYAASANELADSERVFITDLNAQYLTSIVRKLGIENLTYAKRISKPMIVPLRLRLSEPVWRVFSGGIQISRRDGRESIMFQPLEIATTLNRDLSLGGDARTSFDVYFARNVLRIDLKEYLERFVHQDDRNNYAQIFKGGKPSLLLG